eukprot:TRINITY_DN2791_c0_g1_i3.p1 TRINITY_DN2791_c0_g1~~TRINITY_DN2791_c0_g1_i3.p1  ORF type:complete len:138 (+),score=40.12 TRINITY_DN2791_c0_g1_i3:58-471(+)
MESALKGLECVDELRSVFGQILTMSTVISTLPPQQAKASIATLKERWAYSTKALATLLSQDANQSVIHDEKMSQEDEASKEKMMQERTELKKEWLSQEKDIETLLAMLHDFHFKLQVLTSVPILVAEEAHDEGSRSY